MGSQLHHLECIPGCGTKPGVPVTTGGRSQPVALATGLADESQRRSGRLEEKGPDKEQPAFLFLS